MKCPEHAYLQRQKVDELLPRAGRAEEKWGATANGYGISFEGHENGLKWIMVIAAQLCEYTKNHRIVHLK